MIGPHYGEWWNERPAHAPTRLAIVLVSLLLVLAWGVYAGFSGSRLRAALFEATERGDADAVRALLARGGSASAQHADGTALLHWAQEHGHRGLAMLLVREGADVNAVDRNAVAALHRAASRGDAELVSLLLEAGAEPGAMSRRHGAALHWAAQVGSAVIAPTPGFLVTPLHYAAREGHLETIRLLLAHGADANAPSRFYGTPLHWAAGRGQRETVGLLIAQGARAAALNDHRATSLERARQRGHTEVAMLLAAITPAVEPFGTPAAAPRESAGCVLPRRMHRASRVFLDHYIEGDLTVVEFRRLFSLPNSDYLGLGACLIALYE